MTVGRFWVGLLCCALCACGGGSKRAPSPAPAAEPAQAPAAEKPSPPAAAPAATTAPRISEEAARALIEQWLAAQNGGDFDTYAGLYAARFTGVRRTGPKTRPFDRAGWLADRKRMFEKPMQVKAGAVSVATVGSSAVVRFDQDWSTATYRDVGPKQMVLVQEPGGLRIAREELLRSSALPASGSAARFVLKAGAHSYVLLERARDDEPLGKALAVDLGDPAAAVFERGPALPDSLAAWRAGPVRLIGVHGSCESAIGPVRAVAVAYPHFGVIQGWRGEDGVPPPPMAQMAQELGDLYSAWVALEIERPCAPEAALALPAAAPAAVAYPRLEADPALSARARQAFEALPSVRKLGADERDELLLDLSISAFGRGRAEWVVVAAATSCDSAISQFALFRSDGEALVPRLTSRDNDLYSIWALVDLDGDGQPEIAGSPWVPTPWVLIDGRRGRVLQQAELPYNNCPC